MENITTEGALRPMNDQQTEAVGFSVDDFKVVMSDAPGVLLANQNSARKCVEFGNALIERAKNNLTQPVYTELSAFIAKAKKTLDVTNGNRKPFTVLLDKVKKCFTESENNIKDIITKAEGLRNEYVKREKEAEQARRLEALRKQEEANARIRIEQDLTVLIDELFLSTVESAKQMLLYSLTKATLANIDKLHDDVANYRTDTLTSAALTVAPIPSQYVPAEEQKEIIGRIVESKIFGYKETYKSEISSYKEVILSRFPSKRRELEEMQQADEAKRAELEALQKQREAEERARQQREAEAARNRAAQEAEMKANARKLSATIDNQSSLFAQPTVNAKETVRIEVTHAAGYMLLAQFWFENEGKNMPLDKVEKMTFKRIAAWAEKVADTKRVQSEFVKYETVYKAK